MKKDTQNHGSKLRNVICEECHKEFLTDNPKSKFCSPQCKRRANARRHRAKHRAAEAERLKNDPNAVTCRICGFRGYDLAPHITRGHQMTIEQYCKTFSCPRDEILSPICHEKRSLAQKNSTNPNKRRFSSENNPAKGHGGKLSPFSKNFIGYEGLSEEEKQAKVLEVAKKANDTTNEHQNRVTKLEYYTSRGMTEEEARRALSERQTTFSLEKCIEKYGETAGKARWMERQKVWLENYHKQNFSQISQELFVELDKRLTEAGYQFTTYYAIKGEEGKNNEYTLRTQDSYIKPDFYIKELPLVIEFDGAYYHGTLPSGQSRDEYKNQAYAGMNIPLFRVPEMHFRKNKEQAIQECMDFIIKIASTK